MASAARVVSTTSSSVSPTMPPVAITRPSLTRGEALPSRLMAPSTSTWRAPCTVTRSMVARSSARVVGPLTSTQPSPEAKPDDDVTERCVEGEGLEHLELVPRARQRALCRGDDGAGGRRYAGLGEPGEVVGAFAVEAERGESEGALGLGQQRIDDGRLAGVLDEPDDGHGGGAGGGDEFVEGRGGVASGAGRAAGRGGSCPRAHAGAAAHASPPRAATPAASGRRISLR